MKKRIISLILIISMVMGLFSFSLANEMPSPASVGEEMYLDENGILMVPIRSKLEELNYQVNWDNKDRSVELLKGEEEVLLKIGSKDVDVNGTVKNLENPPIIKDKKTFVPVELLSKTLDLIVGWNIKHNNLEIREVKENNEEIFTFSQDEKIKEELNNYMEALEEYENFHGSVLVAKEGKLLINHGYGYSDFTQRTINKPETRFAIGSVTKQFTAVGILKLKEEGLLNLEDSLAKYIPDLSFGEEITIHNLLTHTSGLKNYTDLPEFLEADIENKDPMKMLELVKDLELEFEPGEKFEYSNTNYLILGIIIEKISGKTFEEYLEDLVTPLGMEDTGMIYGEKKGLNDATPYVGYIEVQQVDDDAVLSQAYGAGSMYSTVEDLYRWDRAINSGKLLKEESLEEMFKDHVAMTEDVAYGYGWMIRNLGKEKEIGHGGNTLGFTSYIGRLVDEDITTIILTNNGRFNTNDLKEDLLSIILQEDYEMPKELKAIEIEDEDLYDKYVGKYEFPGVGHLKIFESENKLYAQATNQISFEIFPKSTTEFFAKIENINIEFIVDEEGKATELILSQGGMDFLCKRVEDEEEKKEVEVNPEIYEDYVGEYDLQIGATITIIKEEGKIYGKVTGQEAFEIVPASETEFFNEALNVNIIFVKDDGGKVIKLILTQFGQELEAPKIK